VFVAQNGSQLDREILSRTFEVADDVPPGSPLDTTTEATVQRVEELIRADRRITIDSVVTALECSHGSANSIMHDSLKFRKLCETWVPRELKDGE
jgi:hypothetical protein